MPKPICQIKCALSMGNLVWFEIWTGKYTIFSGKAISTFVNWASICCGAHVDLLVASACFPTLSVPNPKSRRRLGHAGWFKCFSSVPTTRSISGVWLRIWRTREDMVKELDHIQLQSRPVWADVSHPALHEHCTTDGCKVYSQLSPKITAIKLMPNTTHNVWNSTVFGIIYFSVWSLC